MKTHLCLLMKTIKSVYLQTQTDHRKRLTNQFCTDNCNRWILSFSSILNETGKGSIEALHYCKIDAAVHRRKLGFLYEDFSINFTVVQGFIRKFTSFTDNCSVQS